MKKSLIAVAALAAVAGTAHAESSVTLYGVMDAGIRYDSNGAKATGVTGSTSQTQFVNGALNTSRFGIKGTEDLNGGLKANFVLESGLKPSTGAAGTSDQKSLFDRRAVVGLSGAFGAIDLGRNTTFAYDLQGAYVNDPLGGEMVNLDNNSSYGVKLRANPLATFLGTDNNNDARRDSMVKYTGKFGPVTVGAAYSVGGLSGTDANSSAQAMLRYTGNGLDAAVSADRLQDAAGRLQFTLTSGANYTIGGIKATIGYTEINAAANFTPSTDIAQGSSKNAIAAWLPGAASSATSGVSARFMTAGLGYNVLPNVNVVGAYYNTKFSADGISSNSFDTYIVRARYNLSKRTDLYAAVDFTKAKDLLGNQTLNYGTTDTGVTVGMQHRF